MIKKIMNGIHFHFRCYITIYREGGKFTSNVSIGETNYFCMSSLGILF